MFLNGTRFDISWHGGSKYLLNEQWEQQSRLIDKKGFQYIINLIKFLLISISICNIILYICYNTKVNIQFPSISSILSKNYLAKYYPYQDRVFYFYQKIYTRIKEGKEFLDIPRGSMDIHRQQSMNRTLRSCITLLHTRLKRSKIKCKPNSNPHTTCSFLFQIVMDASFLLQKINCRPSFSKSSQQSVVATQLHKQHQNVRSQQ